MTLPPIPLDARKAIPKSWKEAALARTDRMCARLGCEETEGLEYDHALALGLGGKHRADNIQPLCRAHHRQKTNLDLKLIAKAKRLSGETGQRARRERKGGGSIKSKGFGPTNRKFNGSIGPTARARREAQS